MFCRIIIRFSLINRTLAILILIDANYRFELKKKDEKRKFQFDHTNDFYTNKRANKKNISTHLIL